MAGLGPRVLQVLEFAHARAPELQALHELSQHEETTNSTDGKLESQKNQRRRRANAFKAHKIPQRLRFTPKSGFQGSARCRKHERRSHKLLQERTLIDGSETERARWLASHIWHAKRMVMNERFGYVLAARRADKSVSAALQAVRSKAMLHDTSYYGVIELFGLPQVILEALQLVSDPNGSDFHGMRFLAGNEEGRSMLYHEGQFPQGAIAPVTFMWRPLGRDYDDGFKLHEDWQSTKRQLWIWVHPAAYMEAATAIAAACQEVVAEDEEGIEMHDRRGQLCRLKLRGRLADVLMKAVASEGGDVAEEEASDHEDGFDETQTMAKCRSDNRQNLLRALRATGKKTETGEQKDDIYCVDVKDPRLAWWKEGTLCHRSVRPEASFSLLNEPPAHAVPEVGTSVIASPLSGLSLSSRGKDAEEPEPKVILKEMQALLAWTTSSSIGTSSEDGGGSSYPSVIAGGDLAQLDAEVDDSAMEVESSPSSLLWSLSKRRKIEMNFVKDHELNEAVYRQRKEGGNSGGTRVKSQPLAIMAIKKHEPFPRTSGWDLVCSPCSVPGLLKALVFGGALVVGLEEDAALSAVLHQARYAEEAAPVATGTATSNRWWCLCCLASHVTSQTHKLDRPTGEIARRGWKLKRRRSPSRSASITTSTGSSRLSSHDGSHSLTR